MFYIFVFALVLGGIFLYQQFAGGVEAITSQVKTKWLRIILRIFLKILVFSFVVVGVFSTAIVMLAFNYKPDKKN